MIEAIELTKKYGKRLAVDHLNFIAASGQITGFLGPNGAGKTTTLRMLTGYMPPSSGKALIAGYDVTKESMQVRRHLGYLPETVPLYNDMSPLEYLTYIAEIRRIKKNARSLALEALDRVGILSRSNHPIGTLSKGMRQRVGIASAIMHNPPVLILDEPTIGLDPAQVFELRGLVRELGRDHTLLFSTHILSEAEQLCDQLIIINKGRILIQGSPATLREQLQSNSRIVLRVKGNPEQEATLLAALSQIPAIEAAVPQQDEIILSQVVPLADVPHVDPRPAIARTVLELGFDLIELRALGLGLEELFIELTHQDNRLASLERPDHAS